MLNILSTPSYTEERQKQTRLADVSSVFVTGEESRIRMTKRKYNCNIKLKKISF